jgi:hypothetical protein
MLAPEPYLSACLEVLYRATLNARVIGWSGEKDGLSAEQSSQIADLMDAVHNIPHLLQRWEHCDEGLLRSFLETFDTKWKSANAGLLLVVYEEALAKHRGT